MQTGWIRFLEVASLLGQYVFAVLLFAALLQLVPKPTTRWRHLAFLEWRRSRAPDRWMGLLRVERSQGSFQERELLLAGCGITADAAWYVMGRKSVLLLLALGCALNVVLREHVKTYVPLTYSLPALSLAAFLLYADLTWLRAISATRALRITKEIFAVSNQLLYLSDSSLHLHTKLHRCMPFTSAMRDDLEKLLAEWYHDAGAALQRFKLRLGTDEALSFVETLDALRLHESGQYYELLRARIADYKEKIDLAKESRKETTSYLLFVIAGIPILYTFQVFIYPWVREGQKLFESLQ